MDEKRPRRLFVRRDRTFLGPLPAEGRRVAEKRKGVAAWSGEIRLAGRMMTGIGRSAPTDRTWRIRGTNSAR